MAGIEKEDVSAELFFDLENFMNLSRENRIDGAAFEKLEKLWDEWSPLLKIRNLKQDGKSWLAVWLPEEVERGVDKAWEEAPGHGYLVHNLAQFICMSAVQDLIPQTLQGACAPSPKTTPECVSALAEEGFLNPKTGAPLRRYGVLTYYPFKGGCEVCVIKDQCPKGGGEAFASLELPGHERNKGD